MKLMLMAVTVMASKISTTLTQPRGREAMVLRGFEKRWRFNSPSRTQALCMRRYKNKQDSANFTSSDQPVHCNASIIFANG